MAQYRVPQDVEAEDKLLGPFTFRQFIYLLIAAALIALGFFLFKIFPLLAIIPVPPVILLLTLALPLKKDQPMETYLAAVVSFYTKPHKRLWEPGEPESTIIITAPKKVEERRTKEFNSEEASHRLSFLAEIVDTEGYAIKSPTNNTFNDDFVAETNNAEDIFDPTRNFRINQTLQTNTNNHHDALVAQMRQAIDSTHDLTNANTTINRFQSSNLISSPNISPAAATATATPITTNFTPAPSSPNIQTSDYNTNLSYPQPIYPNTPQNAIQSSPQQTATPVYPTPTPVPTRFNTQNINPTPVTEPQPQPTPPNLPSFQNTVNNDIIVQPDLEDPALEAKRDSLATSQSSEYNYDTNQQSYINFSALKPDADEDLNPATLNNAINSDSYNHSEAQPATTPNQTEQDSAPNQDILNLANNKDFSIETIAKQAKRINTKNNDGEVYISLH